MKKAYIIPATENVLLAGERMMESITVSPGTAQDGVHADAPVRKGNPIQGQIKM